MTRSPAALLILALLIANGVFAAPGEERIPQKYNEEKFLETRETEVLERHSMENVNNRESREDEVRNRIARVPLLEPLQSAAESKVASENKPGTNEKVDEVKDMTASVVLPKNDDSTETNKTLPVPTVNNTESAAVETPEKPTNDATDNINNKSPEIETFENKNSTDNSTNGNNKNLQTDEELEKKKSSFNVSDTVLPPLIKNETDENFRKKDYYDTNVQPPNASANSTNNSVQIPVDIVRITKNISSSDLTTNTPVDVVTTGTSTISTTQEPTIKPVTKIENSGKGEEVTESATTIVSAEPSKAELKLHEKKTTPMPTGIVTLITAIAIAFVVVIAYVGLVAWRRYHEWRYGNRELLVNDFDANDIGNFEL